jgi:hypothetical protein
MAEEAVKIYKRERSIIEMVLGQYDNNKTKMVSLKQWNKKCGLLVGKLSHAGDTFVYDTGIELPFEVMEELTDVLPSMSKLANAVNYAELGENKDSFGNEYRTILKSSEYGGLKICRMKKAPTPIDFGVTTPLDDEDVDPAPRVSTTTEKSPHDRWTECWDKFYINKNDDWKKIANILRDFCCAVHAELNNSSEGIDIVPPTPPDTPSQKLISSGRVLVTSSVASVGRPLGPLPPLPSLQPELSLTAVASKKRKGKSKNEKTPKKCKISFEEEGEVCSEVNIEFFFFIKNIEILIVTIFF